MSLPESLADRLVLPAIAAPMTAVTGLDLVTAACRAGIVGSFPVHNARRAGSLESWLETLDREYASGSAPYAPNLIVHRSNRRRDEELATLVAHRVPIVITSVGSPAEVVGVLQDAGTLVFADVASLTHVDRCIEAGVDGLVLLAAGAGGQTGWANPFAFVRAVRERFDGIIVLAGGISDGAGILAASVLGADLVYLGTRMIATAESAADDAYRAALLESTLDDVEVSNVVGGIPASLLRSWVSTHSADTPEGGFQHTRLLGWEGVWTAGHSVSGIRDIPTVQELVDRLANEYRAAAVSLPVVSN